MYSVIIKTAYVPGDKVEKGEYVCTNCGEIIIINSNFLILPKCNNLLNKDCKDSWFEIK